MNNDITTECEIIKASDTPLRDIEDDEFLELMLEDDDFKKELWADIWD